MSATLIASSAAIAVASAALLPAAAAPPLDTGQYDAAISQPVDDPYYPSKGDPGFDALHYDLDLSWAPRLRELSAVATITFRSVVDQDRLTLDLSRDLTADAVTLDGITVPASQTGDHLFVDTMAPLPADSDHELTIEYSGRPGPYRTSFTRRDIRNLGWHTKKDGSVWTMQEPFGAFTWYPVNDHPSDKAFYDATVSVPERMAGVFNGELVDDTTAGGRRTTSWHLASPSASYLVTLAIGDYLHYTDQSASGVPISYWLLQGHTQKMLDVARFLPKAMTWLEKHLGPYPFDRAGLVGVRGGSAMETQTLITMNEGFLQYGARNVVLHELAHQWYGDTVTPDNWKDLWLNEGWAMYAQMRWESDAGVQSMRDWRRAMRINDRFLRKFNGPPGEYQRRDFATDTVYLCAAYMIDQLRTKVGPKAFADLWREWPQQHLNSNVDRDDYIDWASERTGMDLRAFITEWLTSEKTPHLP
jgi:aminopeptidase N